MVGIVLDNFRTPKKPEQGKLFFGWPPCIAEIESLITGEPILIQAYTPLGEIFQY